MQDSVALDAWNEWLARVGLAGIDPASQRLLPLLWDNLSRLGVDPENPDIRQLRRSYRLTLGINRMLFQEISRQLRALHEAGFPTMLLKGAALAVGHYKDHGLRPIGDFDILIPSARTEDAVKFLLTNGWDPAPRSPEAFTRPYRQVVHAHEFHNHGNWEFDLHWHVLDECCRPDADEDFWNGAVRLDLDGVPTALLNPADQLLHVCVHGVRWNDIPPLRWVADAVTVLRASEHALDWDRLIIQAEKRRLILPMRASLNYLRTLLEAPVPAGVLERLGNLPTSRLERFEYRYKTRPYRDRPFGYFPLLWCKHSRLAGNIGLPAKLWGFVPFLQKYWGAENWRQWLRFLLSMSLQTVQRATGSTTLDKLANGLGRVRGVLRPKLRHPESAAQRSPDRQTVHFLHIDKTGGTAIKHALEPVRYTPFCRIELYSHDFTLRDVPNGDKVVFFLRDPIKRFISSFNDRQREGVKPRWGGPWGDAEKAAFMQFSTPNELATALSSKNRSTQEAAILAMKNISHVSSFYWDWFENETYFLSRLPDILFIGSQETLDDDFAILRKMLCLPETIELPKDDINANRGPSDQDTFLGEEALHNLRDWYADDYKFMRLCKQLARRPDPSRCLCLIFSKNRAMQLDALLRSFFMHCKDSDCIDIAVLYLATNSNYEQQYEKVMKANDKITFIKETDFRKQVLDGMAPYDFVLFLVDDSLFVNDFSIMDCIGHLNLNDQAIGFSLRLGFNILYCYPHNAVQSVPEYTEVPKDLINFDWTKGEYDFNFPLELSSSFYRTGDILPLMKQDPFDNPNDLEASLNAKKGFFKNTKRYLMSFRQSAAFSVPANMVRGVHANRTGDRHAYAPEHLNDLFSKGYRIDVEKLSGYIPKGCHEKVELNFIPMEGPDPT